MKRTEIDFSRCDRPDRDCGLCSLSHYEKNCEGVEITFAMRLKRLRASKGLTQKQLAERLNRPVPTIEAWERGLIKPRGFEEDLLEKVKRL